MFYNLGAGANSVDSDQMPHSAESERSLHCYATHPFLDTPIKF